MKLNQHFKQFHRNIKLKKKRLERISSALSNLETVIDGDDQLSDLKIDLFQQGSVAIDTAVIPTKNGAEFDADVVSVFDIIRRPRDKQDPQNVIDWFADRLRKNDGIKPQVKRRTRCVRLEYAGDFHIDIVPAHGGKTGAILVPIKTDNGWEWKPSDPRGYINWVLYIDRDLYDHKFGRVVKMLKHWRNLKMGEASAPKSILLTAMLGYRIKCADASQRPSDAESLVEVMEALNTDLKGHNTKPRVNNPSMKSEDLAERWDDEGFMIFKDKFDWATQKARQALDENDRDRSIGLWQGIFGSRYFPTELDGGGKAAVAVGAGGVTVSSTGRITIGKLDEGILVPGHRSFGA